MKPAARPRASAAIKRRPGNGPSTVWIASHAEGAPGWLHDSLLAEALHRVSAGKLLPMLEQDLSSAHSHGSVHSWSSTWQSLLSCDLALFSLAGGAQGARLPGQFIAAKLADLPCVVLVHPATRGERLHSPALEELAHYPRTRIVCPSAGWDRLSRRLRRTSEPHAATLEGRFRSADLAHWYERLAREVYAALEAVRRTPPLLRREDQETVYLRLSEAAGTPASPAAARAECLAAIERKRRLRLL